MNIKMIIKRFMSPFQCLRFHVKHNRDLYIGKACKIIRGKNIQFGENVSIMPYTMIVCHGLNSKILFGNGAEIGMYSRIAAQSIVSIGRDVFTGPHIFIADYNHEYCDINIPIKNQGKKFKMTNQFPFGGVQIGDETWIGTNVVIIGTVRVGKHCVIGANSVVTKDIPDYCVVVGNPCRIIKKYNFNNNKWDYIN